MAEMSVVHKCDDWMAIGCGYSAWPAIVHNLWILATKCFLLRLGIISSQSEKDTLFLFR